MTVSPATVLGSEMHVLESNSTGRVYRIAISLPLGYSAAPDGGWPLSDVPAKWPVVYLLDGNWYFGMVTDIVRAMSWCGGTNDAIVVGIGYAEVQDPLSAWRDTFARRYRDLTALHDETLEKEFGEMLKRPVSTGDAAHFYQFMKDELIPFVEQEYRADPSRRILAGHSRGGNFTAFALFEAPDLFSTYIMASCCASDEDRFIFRQEEAYAKAHQNLPVKVYLAAGELEESADNTTLTDTLRFASILESRNYAGLSLARRVFRDMNHCEVIAPAFQAGLKFALAKSN